MLDAPVSLVTVHSLELPSGSLVLCRNRLLEREWLLASRTDAVVMGVRALDRITQQHDEPDVAEDGGDALGRVNMRKVIGARLTSDRSTASSSVGVEPRKVRPVPVDPLLEIDVEEMDLLDTGGSDPWTGDQRLVQAGRPRPLRADDEEVGERPAPSGRPHSRESGQVGEASSGGA